MTTKNTINDWTPLAALAQTVTPNEIVHDAPVVAEFVDYIRWLADQDTSMPVEIGKLWALYCYGVRECRYWLEAAEMIELPTRDDWED